MKDFKLLEKEGLIKIYETKEGNKIVNGRELWEGLKSKQDFSTWVKKRLNECDAIENEDFSRFHKKMEANNATKIEYILKIDIAKEMAMLEKNKQGKKYRKYLINIEKKYKQLQQDILEQNELIVKAVTGKTTEDRMIALGEYNARMNKKLEEKDKVIEEQKPKVESYHKLINANNNQTMNEVAKSLKVGRNKLFRYLRESKVLMKSNIPYQRYIDNGYFIVREFTKKIYGEDQNLTQTLVTAKGIGYIDKLLKKVNYILE